MSHGDTASQGPQKVKTILIVEDDSDIGEFLVEILKSETPYHSMLVTDGLQALETIKTFLPDLFLLDYHLPHINGLTLYDQFQGREELRHIPALLMSANVPTQEIEKRRIYYIKKPFEMAELLEKIEEIFSVE